MSCGFSVATSNTHVITTNLSDCNCSLPILDEPDLVPKELALPDIITIQLSVCDNIIFRYIRVPF